MQRNLLYILRNDLDDDFIENFDDDMLKKDKEAFVHGVIDQQFTSKKRAYDIIRHFFYVLIPKEFLKMYDSSDLYYVLNGKEELTFSFF